MMKQRKEENHLAMLCQIQTVVMKNYLIMMNLFVYCDRNHNFISGFLDILEYIIHCSAVCL